MGGWRIEPETKGSQCYVLSGALKRSLLGEAKVKISYGQPSMTGHAHSSPGQCGAEASKGEINQGGPHGRGMGTESSRGRRMEGHSRWRGHTTKGIEVRHSRCGDSW